MRGTILLITVVNSHWMMVAKAHETDLSSALQGANSEEKAEATLAQPIPKKKANR